MTLGLLKLLMSSRAPPKAMDLQPPSHTKHIISY